MLPEQWFDGIWLLGRFHRWFETGCWLLAHDGEAAILEMPPAGGAKSDPADAARQALELLGIRAVKYLICTHSHPDHFSLRTYHGLRGAFPGAVPCLQKGFQRRLGNDPAVVWFDTEKRLTLGSEPLFLVHAPKHSATDTMVVFRGAACTGDWELGTIHSVHDWTRIWAVPESTKLESIERMEQFPAQHNYVIHRCFSVHANDRRTGIDFPRLMASTRERRRL